ncbi:hypothetical protein DXG03_008715 [Asterophora parasitica]|uniref:Uncharacterized protein n=1 Tax=Asterophora parasitica TaxID=117018 RepID=A0A9P7G575_9AGAR|nr:hypothetical protein DXG03_008715 [Asterophora parasitica]
MDRKDWRERATELHCEAEYLVQRQADLKEYFQSHIHALEEQVVRSAEQHEITQTQLFERMAELQSAQLFINQADSLSGAEAIAMANALNAEILQSAAFMADSLDYTQATPLSPEDASNLRDVLIGKDLAQALLSQRGQEHFDPTLVQLAVQVTFVALSRLVVASWTGHNEESLKGIYRVIFEKEPTKLPDNLQSRLSMIVTLMLCLRTAIGESVTSMDIMPCIIKEGSEFNPEVMDDTYADERGPAGRSKDGERVAGSTELGLRSLVRINQSTQEALMLKHKVILSSALKEV